MVETDVQYAEEVVEKLVDEHNLIVFNDHVNTFDHVIDSLIKVFESLSDFFHTLLGHFISIKHNQACCDSNHLYQ